MPRNRATDIVVSNGRVLLIRERRSSRYSLPGGGIERADRRSALTAAIRELLEETSLRATDAKFLFRHRTPPTRHNVYWIDRFSGRVRLQQRELSDYTWWDGKSSIHLSYRTRAILKRSGFLHRGLFSRIFDVILRK